MRRLINWIRSLFCKHDWEKEEFAITKPNPSFAKYEILDIFVKNPHKPRLEDTKVILTCKRCAWVRSYTKGTV